LKPGFQADFVRFSPNGASLVAFTLPDLERFTTATGKAQPMLERRTIKYFHDFAWLSEQQLVGVVTAHGRRLEAGAEEWVVLWDTSTGKILQTITHGSALDVLAAAPDGSRFAEAGVDKKVRIRDAATLAVQQEFRAHDGPITALAWHPTRAILATASTDLSIRLWDLATGRRLEELRGPTRPPHQLSFSPSGHLIGAASSGDSTRVWEPESLNDKPKPNVGDWEDVLAGLTPELVKQTGDGWRMDNGVLFSPAKRNAVLPLPVSLSETSYLMHMKLRQISAKNFFYLALPVANRMVGFVLDAKTPAGHSSGLSLVDGREWKDLPEAVHGKQVKDADQHDLEVAVSLNAPNATITILLDTEILYRWTGRTDALSQHEDWKNPFGSLALGNYSADWVVSALKVKRR
jgi:WD40 repeat protein